MIEMCSSDYVSPIDLILPGSTATVAATGKGIEKVGEALTPDIPKLPDAPKPPPKSIDPKAQGARARERDRARASAGIQSTILTGGGGLTTPASTAPKTLLGQ